MSTTNTRCVTRLLPLAEGKIRACGRPGNLAPDGTYRCKQHITIIRRRARLAAEKAKASE